jgi:hypothetical protein
MSGLMKVATPSIIRITAVVALPFLNGLVSGVKVMLPARGER